MIQQYMIEHFELAQDLRSTLIQAECSRDGCVEESMSTRCELDQSKYIRFSDESFLDLGGPQLAALSKVCLDAYCSEELFLIDANSTNRWLRTVIGHEQLHPNTWTEAEENKLISKIIIHSNIVPYDPYWSMLRARRDGADTRVHFPSSMLQEALEEKKTLKTKLLEWKGSGKECEIGKHGSGSSEDGNYEQPRTSKCFREIRPADVKFERELAKGSDGIIILLITWRGGRFVQKLETKLHEHLQTAFAAELETVKILSHPHIVYSFGELCEGKQSSYFMEYMSNELFSFIVERKRIVGDNKPPFTPHDSVDVLLQIAKAMRHMHQEDVNVVHCDLKSMNILISEIATSENVRHYLVKVADFGSARSGNSGSGSIGFIAGPGTTPYMAPEALQQQLQLKDAGLKDKTAHIRFPHKIDVYSFGIVAFEVLTGDDKYRKYRSPSTFKRGVIGGTVRPLLRAECQRDEEYIQDKELISLIERCWHKDPSKRPSFVEICEKLNGVKVRITEKTLQSDHPPRRANSVWHLF